jgi:tetratricopeptide (TPR) repeat protein
LHCCSIAHNLEGVENVLVTIEKRFSEQRCPVELISEILAYAKKITDIKLDAHKNLLIKITKILSKHSLLSDAVFITQSLAGEESSIIYYHITALLSTFQLISADHWLTILETQTSNNDRDIDREYAHERILIRLLRIWYYRLCGDMTRARRLYDSIEPDMISDKVIRVMYLRYCEIAGSKDAINQLEKALSLSVTLENGCLTQEINLALSMYYGENGDTDKALNLIKEVEEKGVLCGFIIRYASENNFVVTKILKRQAVELRTLREYRKVVLDPFDRLIIDNNLMIAEALSGKINVALLHSAKIAGMTESGNSIEPNIKKISYLNISYVHLMADEPQEAEAYWEAARRIESSVDAEHWSNLFSYGNIHECYAHNRDFFFPPFMTNWNISTDIFLSQH